MHIQDNTKSSWQKRMRKKTAFITPCGTYCFVRMPFGLKNAGSTFARVVHVAFEPQIHRNVEAYMDDIVVKSKDKATLIQDLEETFANLCRINLKLNPEKCVSGVPSGKLLGFFVSQRGIEANPDKIKAIEQIQAPRTVKDVRRLTGCVAALSRFIFVGTRACRRSPLLVAGFTCRGRWLIIRLPLRY